VEGAEDQEKEERRRRRGTDTDMGAATIDVLVVGVNHLPHRRART
jgi:hypothetical protein